MKEEKSLVDIVYEKMKENGWSEKDFIKMLVDADDAVEEEANLESNIGENGLKEIEEDESQQDFQEEQ